MTTKTILLATAALFVLAACSNENEGLTPSSKFPADGVIRVATHVNALQTRAGWDDVLNPLNQDFNIWITPQGESTGSPYIYQRKKMNYSKNSAWTAYEWKDAGNAEPLTLLWKNSETPIDVVALYFQSDSSGVIDLTSSFKNQIGADQSSLSNVAKYDYLYFKGTVDPALQANESGADGKVTKYALMDGKIQIPFHHINAKLDLTLTLGTEFNITPGTVTNPLEELNVNGTVGHFEWDFSTGVITKYTDFGEISSPITPYHNAAEYAAGNGTTVSAVAKYECILVPQDVAAKGFTVSFKIGGKEYKCNHRM